MFQCGEKKRKFDWFMFDCHERDQRVFLLLSNVIQTWRKFSSRFSGQRFGSFSSSSNWWQFNSYLIRCSFSREISCTQMSFPLIFVQKNQQKCVCCFSQLDGAFAFVSLGIEPNSSMGKIEIQPMYCEGSELHWIANRSV